MNEIQIYFTIAFFAGVLLTQVVFYFDRLSKKKRFYTYMSAAILQMLDSVHSVHLGAIEFASTELKTLEETERQEYLDKESEKVLIFMELYLLVLKKAVPSEGRKYINYKNWAEAKVLIEELRGFMKNEQSKG
jgi:hypothetical protein